MKRILFLLLLGLVAASSVGCATGPLCDAQIVAAPDDCET